SWRRACHLALLPCLSFTRVCGILRPHLVGASVDYQSNLYRRVGSLAPARLTTSENLTTDWSVDSRTVQVCSLRRSPRCFYYVLTSQFRDPRGREGHGLHTHRVRRRTA